MEKQIELINKYFSTIRNNNSNINTFFSFLDENEIHYAALGGSVRAALNNSSSLRDIDIVYQTDYSLIQNYLLENGISFKQNTFNGLKFNIDNIQFDVWNIDNHFAFKEKYYKADFKNIYKTTFLNYDSIMYDFTNNKLYDKEYTNCINDQLIDIIGKKNLNKNNPNMALSICKVLKLKKEKKYSLSNRAKEYIRNFYEKCASQKKCMLILQQAYEKHYKKKIKRGLSIYIKNELKKI